MTGPEITLGLKYEKITFVSDHRLHHALYKQQTATELKSRRLLRPYVEQLDQNDIMPQAHIVH